MLRPCPNCAAPRSGPSCPRCGWKHSSTRTRQRRDLGTYRWRVRSRTARELHVERHGLICPGLDDHEPHHVDSITDLALHELDGPGSHPDRCVVLCASENGRIGAPE